MINSALRPTWAMLALLGATARAAAGAKPLQIKAVNGGDAHMGLLPTPL